MVTTKKAGKGKAAKRKGIKPAATSKPAVVAAKPKAPAVDLDVYQVFRDMNGVAYLRVGHSKIGAQFVVNKGFSVDLIDMHSGTCRTLALQAVAGASVLEAAKRLLQPLNDQTTISQRAKEHLEQIINNKEIQMKATTANAKPAKFATVNAPAAKGKKAATAKPAKAAAAAASKAEKKADGRTSYAGKKIVVLNKEHGAREGTKRAIGMDIIIGSKNTDDALPKLAKAGCDASFIRFAVDQKFVKLTDAK